MSSSQRKNIAFTPMARQPTFQCSHCIRCLYSRAGLKSHVLAKHGTQATTDRASQASSPASNQPSSPQHSDNEHDVEHPMDVDADVQLPFPDAYDDGYDYDNDLDVDVDVQQPFPGTYSDGYGYNNDSDVDLHDHNLHHSNSPSSPPIIPSSPHLEPRSYSHQQTPANDRFLRRVYHDKLNGEFIKHFKISISYILHPGQKCDQHGDNIAADLPPPPRESDHGPNDWTPYAGRVEFELADFLYRRNQMSASDIDILLNLWNASTVAYGISAPFQNHKHLYDTIDATPLGDIPWKSFSLQFNGNRPEGEVPSWMDAGYDVWFRDPHKLVHNIISNPDFENGFDYTPYQEHKADGSRCYHNFMSANWSWKQAVCNTNELFYITHI